MSYVTKDEVKKYLGVNFTNTMDAFVDTVIAGCQSYIERFCGDDRFGKRVFEAPDPDDVVVRLFDGNGDKRLYVGDLFVLDSLTVDGVLYTADNDFYAYPLNNDEEAYQYIELTQPETRLNSNSRVGGMEDYIFGLGQATIEVGGNWYFTETPPADITIAMMKLVGAIIKENIGDGDVKEKKAETLGDYQVTYQDVNKVAHALGVKDILLQYKRKSPSGSAGIIKVS